MPAITFILQNATGYPGHMLVGEAWQTQAFSVQVRHNGLHVWGDSGEGFRQLMSAHLEPSNTAAAPD